MQRSLFVETENLEKFGRSVSLVATSRYLDSSQLHPEQATGDAIVYRW